MVESRFWQAPEKPIWRKEIDQKERKKKIDWLQKSTFDWLLRWQIVDFDKLVKNPFEQEEEREAVKKPFEENFGHSKEKNR